MSEEPSKKHYEHVFEAATATPEELDVLRAKMAVLFNSGCKRILMVQIPQISEENFLWDNAKALRYPNFPPYGPSVIVRAIESAGYTADIIDLGFEVISRACSTKCAEEFRYDCWKGIIEKKVGDFRPDLIGLSCMFNMGHGALKDIATHLKRNFPATPIVAGGVHISLTYAQVLEDIPAIDFASLYEGDRSFVSFLNVASGKSGVESLSQIAACIEGNIIRMTHRMPPTELHCEPDYKGIPIGEYSKYGRIGAYTFLRPQDSISGTVLSARGCRARCGFCSVRSVNGNGVRIRDFKEVVDEVENLKKTYGIDHIMWLDDDLFFDGERAIALFEELALRNLGVTWDASNGIIASALNPRLVQACVDSGCAGFNIGIESGNPEILHMMKKPGTVASFRKAAKLLDEAPQIFTKGFIVIGFPNENLRMLMDTVNLAVEMQLDWYPIQILTPMPGTPVFQMMQDQGLLGDIPTTVLGKARTFSVGATSNMGQKERMQKEHARAFQSVFTGDMEQVPKREDMEDIWFTIDYRINYEPILRLKSPEKLNKKRLMLREIVERMTAENALAHLFLAIAEFRSGSVVEADRLIKLARGYRDNSAFWRLRFDAFNLDSLLDAYIKEIQQSDAALRT
jgi:radical SAM superfamily enzyme YgiQ (UPF0313 family)